MGLTEVAQPIKLYLDEMIPLILSKVLRQHGYDVLSVKEADMFGKSDKEQLAFAALNERAIITFDINHYTLLHHSWLSQGKEHFGIIVSPEIRISKLIQHCLRMFSKTVHGEIKNQLHFLQEFF